MLTPLPLPRVDAVDPCREEVVKGKLLLPSMPVSRVLERSPGGMGGGHVRLSLRCDAVSLSW